MSPSLSPDGRWLGFLAPDASGVLQVWVRELSTAQERVLTRDPARGIRSFVWTFHPGMLLYLQDADGDENFHVYGISAHSGAPRDLTPFSGVKAQIIAVEPEVPGEFLVGLNKEDARRHDVCRLDLQTGALALEEQNPGDVIGWTADAHLKVRAAVASRSDGGFDIRVRESLERPWRILLAIDPDDQATPIDFVDDRTLLVLSSQGAQSQRLLAIDMGDGTTHVLAEDLQYDVCAVLRNPRTRAPEAVAVQRARLEWQALGWDVLEDLQALQAQTTGDLGIARSELSDRRWLISESRDNGPTHYYLYVRESRSLTLLFSQRRDWESLSWSSMAPVVIVARDRTPLNGYLTRPAAGPARAGILLVHGGPWVRDRWGFQPTVQWLANRGYAVLQVNYRGSAGYGKAFLNAGNGEWGRRMQDDLTDAAAWLARETGLPTSKIGIMGGSYGGYATLAALAFTPEVFACGVDIVGPSSLVTLIQSIPPYWAPLKASMAKRLGIRDEIQDEAFLKERSPLYFAGRIRRPLLIGQGANDPRVKKAESDQIASALRARGIPVEYWVYDDEGHGFLRPENRMHFFGRVEAFLARHLGGAAEPPDEPPGHRGRPG